ncbi:hypothetical protein V8E51_007697 [Hyaloscypha variabilis]
MSALGVCLTAPAFVISAFSTRTMWIGAICINQLDIKERGSQVGWDETPESKSAFEGTRNCIAVAADNFDNDVEKLAIIIKNDPSAQQSIVYLDIDIGMRPWFTRTWVLQGAAVSKDLTLKCGSDEISCEEFARFHDLLGTALAISLFSLLTSLQKLDRVSDITSTREALTEGVPVPLSHLVA